MNSTPQEKLILEKFYKHLDPSIFWVCVNHASWSEQAKFYIGIYPVIKTDGEPLFTGYYSSQQEALDKAEEVCMMVLFGVQQ